MRFTTHAEQFLAAKAGGEACWLIDEGEGVDRLSTGEASGVLVGHRGAPLAALAEAWRCAAAAGHGEADAAVLASLSVRGRLPWLGLGDAPPWACEGVRFAPFAAPSPLYGIVADLAALERGLSAGLRLVQLRVKRPLVPGELARARLLALRHGAQLWVNDDYAAVLGAGEGAAGLHLGQEDLAALPEAAVRVLRARAGTQRLGLSSHCPWEMARAAGCAPSYIACGPVRPTTTKDMPWRAQGLDNLAWWVAVSPAPVVAIGGLLDERDVAWAMGAGPAAACVVRGLQLGRSQLARRISRLAGAAQGVTPGFRAPAWPQPAI
ncbi:thiamine phosphate synthase [Crenobacter intestini]|uniref:Thiamine phosphate synthase n=1 Tax=Crenobacter intestini TaxID=2563443 RepID=A0A4T0V5N0_9NEIS|nr:thiamine phosphate synthase [Crenobacter intestini]TIC86899.1 thiamine phosphate synthase [Crenobacter intestini]